MRRHVESALIFFGGFVVAGAAVFLSGFAAAGEEGIVAGRTSVDPQLSAIYADWAATVPRAPVARSVGLQRGTGFGPGLTVLPGIAWVAYYSDRPGAPIRSQPMPVGTPTPWGQQPDFPPNFSACPTRAAWVRWFGYVPGRQRCPGDRPGEAACGGETEGVFAAALARLYELDRENFTTARNRDGRPTREELGLATGSCSRALICAANRLPGGLQAPECWSTATCSSSPGCYRDRLTPRGQLRRLVDTAYGCGELPVCGTGPASPAATCGNHLAEPGETCASCPADVPCVQQPGARLSCGADGTLTLSGGWSSVTYRPGVLSTGTAGNVVEVDTSCEVRR